MSYSWLELLSVLLIIDSLGALWVAFYGQRWYLHQMGVMAKYLPPAKGWALLYCFLAGIIFLLVQTR